MTKLVFFLLVGIAVASAYPKVWIQNEDTGTVPFRRIVRSADPDPQPRRHGFGGGFSGGYGQGGYGGNGGGGGYGGYPQGGGNAFAQSSSNAGAFSSPYGSGSFASSNANAGAFGR